MGGILNNLEVVKQALRQFKWHIPLKTEWESFWFLRDYTFNYDQEKFHLFVHWHNCGWPPGRMTERSVELALADAWLIESDPSKVIEIGAVTPYYWPKRVAAIVDPGDDHPLVTARTSVMDLDLKGRAVLSISTFEHIGSGEYGQEPSPHEGVLAFEKLFAEAETFLVTVPMGYNDYLDKYMMNEKSFLPPDVSMRYLTRSPRGGNAWRECERPDEDAMVYGRLQTRGNRYRWANTVIVLERRLRRETTGLTNDGASLVR